VEKLLVAGALTGQTGMYCQSDRYTTSIGWTKNLLSGREPVREEASWVDLASADQLDPPLSTARMKGDKKLGFGKEGLGFEEKK
jgi:hypothetical protein